MQHLNPDIILDVSTGTNIIDLVVASDNQITIIKDLLLYIDLQTITKIKALPQQIDFGNQNITIPSKEIVIHTYSQGAYRELDRFFAVRYVLPYRENLLSHLTEQPELVLSPGGRIALSIRDSGTGVLGSGDRLRVFGQALTTGTNESNDFPLPEE